MASATMVKSTAPTHNNPATMVGRGMGSHPMLHRAQREEVSVYGVYVTLNTRSGRIKRGSKKTGVGPLMATHSERLVEELSLASL